MREKAIGRLNGEVVDDLGVQVLVFLVFIPSVDTRVIIHFHYNKFTVDLFDVHAVEAFADDGKVSMSSCLLPDPGKSGLELFADGGLLFCTTHFVQDHCSMDELRFAFDLVYRLVREEGPPHARVFTSEVSVGVACLVTSTVWIMRVGLADWPAGAQETTIAISRQAVK